MQGAAREQDVTVNRAKIHIFTRTLHGPFVCSTDESTGLSNGNYCGVPKIIVNAEAHREARVSAGPVEREVG